VGAFLNSIQIKTRKRRILIAALALLADQRSERYYVGPCLNGWIGVYPNMGQDESIGEALAKELGGTAWQVLVHDDDILMYWLWRQGELVDSYHSNPGYFGGEDRAEQESQTGNPDLLARLVGGRSSELRKLLDRENRHVFESTRLGGLQEAAGLKNLVTSYEDLKRSDGDGIEQWSKFEEVPAEEVWKEQQERRRLRSLAESEWQQLKAAGLLLLHDPRIEDNACGCAIQGGFIVAWPSYRWQKVSFSSYREPWDKPEPVVVDTPHHVGRIVADASGKRVAIAAGTRVRVWDVAADDWQLVADIPEEHHGIAVALAPDGELVAHGSAQGNDVVVTRVSDGRTLCGFKEHAFANPHAVVEFHPSGEWMVSPGIALQLVPVQPNPRPRKLFVGGKYVHSAEERADRLEMGYTEAQIEEEPPRGNEIVSVASFSRDGRWLWCGTDRGFRVYDWNHVPRESDAEMTAPTWVFDAGARPLIPVTPQAILFGMRRIYSVSEEHDGRGVVFAGDSGCVYRLDLKTGQTRQLIEFTGDNTQVHGLQMSTDGKTLGVATRTFSFSVLTRRKVMYGERWTWHIWSYPRLLESPCVRCPTPVEPD
jgi:hypothetical protein